MEGIKIGIGRVSTKEQNPQRQIDAFLKEGIEERYIFIDKCTSNGGNLEKARIAYHRRRGQLRRRRARPFVGEARQTVAHMRTRRRM